MLEELRISSLGVIDESVLELGPGFTAITGETGAGKTMVVTALGLLLGGRADSGAVRTGARRPASRAWSRSDSAGARGRGRRGRGRGRGRPAGAGPADLRRGPVAGVRGRRRGPGLQSRVAGRPARGGARPVRPAPAAAPGRAARRARQLRRGQALDAPGPVRRAVRRAAGTEAELADVVDRPASAPARPTCCASGSARSRRSTRSPARRSRSRPRSPGSASRTPCAPPPSRPASACPPRTAARTRSAPSPRPASCSTGCASTTRGGRAGRPARRGQLPALRRGGRRGVVRHAAWTPTRPGWPRSPNAGRRWSRSPASTARPSRTCWPGRSSSAARLLELDNTDERIAELARAARPARAPSWPTAAAALTAARTGRPPRSAGRSPPSSAALAMPHAPAERARSTQSEDEAGPRGRRPLAAVRARPGSTTSSCCSPPTGAPSRARWARAPRAVSSPG